MGRERKQILVWLFEDHEYIHDPEAKNVAFVYLIENLKTGKKYIGKKRFEKTKQKSVKKKKKKVKVPSDWMTYFGSNDVLSEDVKQHGEENFRRTILRLCKSLGEASYYEAKFQFVTDAILRDDYYNTWIMVRIRKDHMKHCYIKEGN